MRILISILTIISISCIYTSCCKGPFPVAGITLSYPNLTSSEPLKAIRTDRNNLSTIIDTINIGELNATNNSAFIELENESVDYIIYIENTQYIDTISEIIIEREGCKEKIKHFQYRFNGNIQTDNKQIIN